MILQNKQAIASLLIIYSVVILSMTKARLGSYLFLYICYYSLSNF